jgi:hypothetical protein
MVVPHARVQVNCNAVDVLSLMVPGVHGAHVRLLVVLVLVHEIAIIPPHKEQVKYVSVSHQKHATLNHVLDLWTVLGVLMERVANFAMVARRAAPAVTQLLPMVVPIAGEIPPLLATPLLALVR